VSEFSKLLNGKHEIRITHNLVDMLASGLCKMKKFMNETKEFPFYHGIKVMLHVFVTCGRRVRERRIG
jgi:hypothetical protein